MSNNPQETDPLGSFYMGRMRPPTPQPKRVLPRGGIAVLSVMAFAAIIWYAYPQGAEKYDGADVPVITADASPYKFKPEDPGGIKVPHRDSTVFNPLEKKAAPGVEKLMPKPEEPLDTASLLKGSAPAAQLNLDLQMKPDNATVEKHAVAKPKAKPSMASTAKPAAVTPAAVKPAAAKAAAPSKAAVKSSGTVYVQLGSFRELSGAKKDWDRLQKKYPQYLGPLSMRTERVDLGSKGVFNRLQAGTVSEARAQEICNFLKKADAGGCIVVR